MKISKLEKNLINTDQQQRGKLNQQNDSSN